MKFPLFAYLISYCLILFSCAAKITDKKEDDTLFITEQKPALDSVRFDIKKFEKNSYDQKIFKENFKKAGFDAQYEEELPNGKHLRQITVFTNQENGEKQEYVEEIYKKWSPFVIRKQYDYKGRLRIWAETFRLEGINKSYEYDEQGEIIKINNFEEDFKHSFADIREFLLKAKDIDIFDTRQAIARRINHKFDNPPQVYYTIDVFGKEKENNYLIVIIDETLELKEYRDEKDFK